MKKPKLNASSLKALLLVVLFVIIAFIAGGFYFAQDWLSKFANDVNASSAKSSTAKMSPKELNQIQADLFKNQTAVEKATSITASQRDYNSKIQQDINRYASKTGIKITDFGPGNTQSSQTATPLATGVRTGYVSITIQNPISYINLVKFMQAIETNIPKMRLTGISLDRVESPKGYVNVKPITIEIYIR